LRLRVHLRLRLLRLCLRLLRLNLRLLRLCLRLLRLNLRLLRLCLCLLRLNLRLLRLCLCLLRLHRHLRRWYRMREHPYLHRHLLPCRPRRVLLPKQWLPHRLEVNHRRQRMRLQLCPIQRRPLFPLRRVHLQRRWLPRLLEVRHRRV